MTLIYCVYHIGLAGFTLSEGYIGITNNLSKRIKSHRKHGNQHLRSAMAKYGSSIIVKELVRSRKEYCLELEQKLRPLPNIGWNIAPGGGVPPIAKKGRKLSKEAVEKIRLHNIELGRRPEQRARLSSLHSGKVISEQHKKALSIAHGGKPKTEETRKKISIATAGRVWPTVTCEKCGITVTIGNHARWHGSNCRIDRFSSQVRFSSNRVEDSNNKSTTEI